ncbi:hypothetical protein JOC94_002741 [Bacillus thermophilus]|uniref:Uncharacterized protein n=1 Tax=Siminovitchia thermophila TaxID=1245522 RepID=A0ABS2R7W5_9BACI|nr:hypothetical protein [Siminovitchia thermophila]
MQPHLSGENLLLFVLSSEHHLEKNGPNAALE